MKANIGKRINWIPKMSLCEKYEWPEISFNDEERINIPQRGGIIRKLTVMRGR